MTDTYIIAGVHHRGSTSSREYIIVEALAADRAQMVEDFARRLLGREPATSLKQPVMRRA